MTALLNELASRLDDPSLTDEEVDAVNEALAAVADAVIARPVEKPRDLLDKIAALRLAVTREWEAVLPNYIDRIKADAELLCC